MRLCPHSVVLAVENRVLLPEDSFYLVLLSHVIVSKFYDLQMYNSYEV
jgi:hypothetical protein